LKNNGEDHFIEWLEAAGQEKGGDQVSEEVLTFDLNDVEVALTNGRSVYEDLAEEAHR
jgi:hypothetical protein